MPQTNRLRYTTYANPRLRRTSAGYLVASTDLEVAELPVCATLKTTTTRIEQHPFNDSPLELYIYRENDYTGPLDITLGVKIGSSFKELYNSGPVFWDGSRSVLLDIPDVGYFDVPLEIQYRVLPVNRPEFIGFEDKLVDGDGITSTLVVKNGIVAETSLRRDAFYSVSLTGGFLTFNTLNPPQFGADGKDRTAYTVGTFYSPDKLRFDVIEAGHAYLQVKTQYSEKCGGMGHRFPPVVGMFKNSGNEIKYSDFTGMTYLSLSDSVPESYGTYSYDIPDTAIARGQYSFVVMEALEYVNGEYVSTEVTDMQLQVRKNPFTETFTSVKRVVVDCSEIPIRDSSSLRLTVSIPPEAGFFLEKTYPITSTSKRISFPVLSTYKGKFSYNLTDNQGRIVDRATYDVSAGTDQTQVLINPSNYLYKTLEYYLIVEGSIATVQEKNPWTRSITVSIAETSKISFEPSEIGLKLESSPPGTSVNITRDLSKHNSYTVTVFNPTANPLATTSTPLVLKPYRISGVPRGDIELFVQKTIPVSIKVATAPTVPVFTPVPSTTDMGEIVAGVWYEGTVVTLSQIKQEAGLWTIVPVSAGDQLKLGYQDTTLWAVGISAIPSPSVKVPYNYHYRLDYKFLNGINTNVTYYIRDGVNTLYPNSLQYPTLGSPASTVDPWYSPTHTKGGWRDVGGSSSLGLVPLYGYEQTNLKLFKLPVAAEGNFDMLILPSQTTTLTLAGEFKFFSRYQ